MGCPLDYSNIRFNYASTLFVSLFPASPCWHNCSLGGNSIAQTLKYRTFWNSYATGQGKLRSTARRKSDFLFQGQSMLRKQYIAVFQGQRKLALREIHHIFHRRCAQSTFVLYPFSHYRKA